MPTNVAWYYHRKNCETCAQADAFLARAEARVRMHCDARVVRYDAPAALALVRKGQRVLVVRGPQVLEFDLRAAVDEAALQRAILGPFGNLRAPTIRVGQTVVVGFSVVAYRAALGIR